MYKEKAGEIAGEIWESLNQNVGQDFKSLKKVTKETEGNLLLGLGWLLREDKISCTDGKFNLK